MKRFLLLCGAHAKELFRDKLALFWFVAFPLLFILVFGSIFGGSAMENHKHDIGLVAEGNGLPSIGLIRALKEVHAFTFYSGTKEEELDALRKGKRLVVLVIPRELDENIISTRSTDVPVYYEPGNENTTSVVISAIRQVLTQFERQVSGSPPILEAIPIEVDSRQLKRLDYQLPGILGMALMQLGFFGTMNFVSLRQRKVLRRLSTTPLSPFSLLWSEIVVRLFMAVFQTCLIILVGSLVFGFRMVGNPLMVLGTVILGALVFISLGYCLVNFSRTQESAQGIVQAVQFPMMFLSGILFPIDIIPKFIRPVTAVLPLTYLGDALRHVLSGMPSLYGFGTDILILSVWVGASVIFTCRLFRWE